MHDAIKNLSGVWSYKKLLYLGFGARSFVDVMADSQMGINCIALCSALAGTHDVHACAWILDELWKVYGFPQEYLPSHSQFTNLVKACSGVLATTDFSAMPAQLLGHTLDVRDTVPTMSEPENIAKAVRGLFELSKGNISRMTVTELIECAFVAAFAHWLLNLKVYVGDQAGRVIHQDCDSDEAQVVVIYRQATDFSVVQISSTTFVLGEVKDILERSPIMDQTFLYLRVPWNQCLSRVSGSGFSDLRESPTILGDLLGSTARVFRALAMGESDVGSFSRHHYIDFVESSYGQGFIHSTITTFPELSDLDGLVDQMQMALKTSVKEAARTVEKTVLDLAQLCKCSACTRGGQKSEGSCRLVIGLTIRAMVSIMSCTVRDSRLLPTIRGIQCLYKEIATDLASSRTYQGTPLLSVALGLARQDMVGDFAQRRQKFDALSHPVELFSGHSFHDRYIREPSSQGYEFCTATVRQGICY